MTVRRVLIPVPHPIKFGLVTLISISWFQLKYNETSCVCQLKDFYLHKTTTKLSICTNFKSYSPFPYFVVGSNLIGQLSKWKVR